MSAPAALLDQDAAAAWLGLKNAKTLAAWRLRRQGPPYVKLGSRVKYRVSDLAKYIEAHLVAP